MVEPNSPSTAVTQMQKTGESIAAGTFVSHRENACRVAVVVTSDRPSNSAEKNPGKQSGTNSVPTMLTSHGAGEPS